MTKLKRIKLLPLFLALLFILPLAGCIERKISIFICKIIPEIDEGRLVYWEIRESVAVLIPPGKIIWSGNFENFGNNSLPPEVRFLIEHRAKGGAVLESWSLLVPVNSNGVIPKMSAPFPGAILGAKERLRWNFIPVGDDFPGGQLNMRVKYLEDAL